MTVLLLYNKAVYTSVLLVFTTVRKLKNFDVAQILHQIDIKERQNIHNAKHITIVIIENYWILHDWINQNH